MSEQYIQVSPEIKLWVETYGNQQNEACLFISGAGANSSFWSEKLCDSLVKNGFYVIKYDHRDFGYSTKIDWEKNPYEFMDLVNDAIAILDSLSIQKTHFIGHSMGGFIAQLVAIHYPNRILSMTSASASTNSPEIPPPPARTWEIFMEMSPTNSYKQDLDGFMKVWEYLNGTAKFDKELAVEYTKNLYQRQEIIGALGDSHVKAQETLTDRSEQLKQINIPSLIIHGEEDYLVDQYGGIQNAECIKNSKLVMIPQMGHLPFNHEILSRFENEIIQFLINSREQ